MLNTSTAYRKALLKDSKLFQQRIVITLTDNTEIILDNSKLWKGGLTFDEAVSADGVFEVGTAVIGSCSFTINNLDDTYTTYDFAKARVVPSLGLLLPDGTTEYLKKGEYIVDDTAYNGTTIRVSSLDKMSLFDRPYDTALAYPATLTQIVNDACLKCGVTLDANSTNFPHRTYSVAERPSSESTTYREVISYVAQITGCFAKMNNNGYLTFKWFNQSAIETTPELRDRMADIADFVFNTYKAYSWEGLIKSAFINADGLTPTGIVNFSGIFSHTVNVDDVVITGVKVKYSIPGENTDSEYSTGTDGYVIGIEGNALIQSAAQAKQVGDWLGSQLVGFRYRIASVSHLPDPTIEAGDVGFLIDRKGNVFPIIVSGTNFKPGAIQSTRSSGATPARNSATRYSAETKNYVRLKEIIKEVDDYYQNGLDELSEALAGKGGLYTTIEAQATGGNIYYLHDEPDLADSTVVWKMNNEAWGVSTNGGQTWNGGMTINGDVIARYLKADGVNANWIRTGEIADANRKNVWDLDNSTFSMAKGSISLGALSGGGYNFNVTDAGVLTMKKGSITLGDMSNTSDSSKYYFNVDTNGKLSWNSKYSSMSNTGVFNMKSGSINLGYISASDSYGFTVNNNGVLTTQRGDYKITMSNGSVSFYYDDELAGGIGAEYLPGDLNAPGPFITIGEDAGGGGFIINRPPGSNMRQVAFFYDRDNDRWQIDRGLAINCNTTVSAEMDVYGALRLNDNDVATQSWVQSQGYLTSHQSLSGYATESWVNNKGYLTSSSLSGYATQSWVNSQGFVKWSALDLSGYATKSDLNDYVQTSTAQVGGLFTAIVETRGAHTNMLLDELTWWYGEDEFTGRTGNYTIGGHTYSFRRGVLVGYT